MGFVAVWKDEILLVLFRRYSGLSEDKEIPLGAIWREIAKEVKEGRSKLYLPRDCESDKPSHKFAVDVHRLVQLGYLTHDPKGPVTLSPLGFMMSLPLDLPPHLEPLGEAIARL